MIWVVLLILAIVAFFGYKGLHRRHVARCRHDERTHEHVPESISEQTEHKAFHEKNAAISAQNNGVPADRVAQQRGGPSLLYAERTEQQTAAEHRDETNPGNSASDERHADSSHKTATGSASGNASGNASERADNADQTNATATNKTANEQWQKAASDSMDFTAETATLSSDEVGIPANSSDYHQIESSQTEDQIAEVTLDNQADTVYEFVETEQTIKSSAGSVQTAACADAGNAEVSNTGVGNTGNSNTGIAAAGVTAAAAGIGIASAQKQNTTEQNPTLHHGTAQQETAATASTDATQQASPTTAAFAEGIDLELGDSTHNDPDDVIDNNDELLDFGDLTADISEMLKELNLREADSPRLEINKDEFAQLKTGEPGEVKQEKIENVAGKLRNMLQ